MSVRVKICGVRRSEDARLAVELGAVFIGCVLADDSPRAASPDQMRAVREAAGADAEVVLVSRGVPVEAICSTADAVGLRRLQPHGATPDELALLERAGYRVHRVYSLPVGGGELPVFAPEPTADRPVLLDVGRGGAGKSFDWSILGERAPANVFIAGGISPQNVRDLLLHRPFGIDVSSGVEQAPGIKDPDLLDHLFRQVGCSGK